MYCGNCGAGLPAEARFCLVCGAPAPARAPAAEGASERTTRIRLWRGYVKSEFYVELDDPEGPALLRSLSFGWRRSTPPPPERDDVREAYEDLVARLVELGWEQVGRLSPWYAQRFRKRDDHLQAVAEDEAGGRVRDLRKEAP